MGAMSGRHSSKEAETKGHTGWVPNLSKVPAPSLCCWGAIWGICHCSHRNSVISLGCWYRRAMWCIARPGAGLR